MSSPLDAVTGAFSYSGAAIARDLLAAGRRVRTLTGHPDRAPADTPVDVRALDFEHPSDLASSLQGVHTLYNTYWVRFAKGGVDHDAAVTNSRVLFEAAAVAGVQRIVHVSITNPSLDSPYPYFRGKAEVEQILGGVGVGHAIVRPAILFGGDGVLVNNIAWLLRHLPVFGIGARGRYRVRGIHIDDLARLCVELGQRNDSVVLDAVGPQSVTFRELVEAVRAAVGSRALVVPMPPALVPLMSRGLGLLLRDTLLTRDEYRAMADGLADSAAPSTGRIVLTEWVAEHGAELGRRYANELVRHFRPDSPRLITQQ
ncbi:MAG: NAD(P)H-binding protein [Actinomycetota bacterium]|nr:NAD(P)H-binding protein [Actinomycetota bacterium]